MKWSILIIITCLLSFPATAIGSEIDSFTPRYKDLGDATAFINESTRELLGEVVERVNDNRPWWTRGCDARGLHHDIWWTFWSHGGPFRAIFEEQGDLDVTKVPIEDSVYRDFTLQDSPILGGLGKVSNTMGTVFRMGDLIIGSDKFEHVFGFGYGYYVMHYRWGLSMEAVLEANRLAERYVFGSLPTAVDSYADLAVNIAGIRLLNSFIGAKRDIITGQYPSNPYLRCEGSDWVFNEERTFDWRDWVDASWDEGNNCSAFKTERATNQVLSRLDELEEIHSQPHHCPIDSDALEEATQKYGLYRDQLINPSHRAIQ